MLVANAIWYRCPTDLICIPRVSTRGFLPQLKLGPESSRTVCYSGGASGAAWRSPVAGSRADLWAPR
jgi:hypothetical protein